MASKPKFNLNAVPTFKAPVLIPVPGGKPAEIVFTFKHRTRDEFKAFIEGLTDRGDVEVIMDIASGWDLEDAFDETGLDALTQNYLGSARVVIETYINELTSAKLKN